MNQNNDLIGSTISFETYQKERLTNLRLLSYLDPGTVVALGFDAPAKHVQNYPFLPEGTPDDWQKYMYAKFVDAENKPKYFGLPWINQSSIAINDNPQVIITIGPGGATQAQLDNLKSMMTASGITDFVFTTL